MKGLTVSLLFFIGYWTISEERIADDKRWNVSGEIKNFGRNIFDEGYIEKGDGLRRKLQDKDCIKNYRRTLQAIETEALEQMKGFADNFSGYWKATVWL